MMAFSSCGRSILLTIVTMIATVVSVAEAQADSLEWLNAHNAARQSVVGANIPDLVWNAAAYDYALAYAQQKSGQCRPLTHSDDEYGENLAWNGDTTATASWAVAKWTAEKPFYDYASNSCVGGECGHYTQVVWAASTSLGCASVSCSDGGLFFICNYDPAGNVPGLRPYNRT